MTQATACIARHGKLRPKSTHNVICLAATNAPPGGRTEKGRICIRAIPHAVF